LSAAAYGMVLLYATLDRWLGGKRGFAFVQLVGDAAIVTWFVEITGGLTSPMSFLYLLPIGAAAFLVNRGGALLVAAASYGLYAGLIGFERAWKLLAGPAAAGDAETGRVLYGLVAHLVALGAFALLAAYLSERLRVQGRELEERHGTVARLQALNENIIESINSGLITTDLAGNAHFINRGGTAILGYEQSDVADQPIEALFGLDPGFRDEIRAQLLERRRFRFEKFFDMRDGRRIYLGIAVSRLHDRAGRSLGYIFIFQDLTEIHALEQEVRLKERIVALGQMAAGMAHELRNPLAAICGSVE
jgi:two-component system sensor histidine kinase PilS (NtrC family)